MLRSLPARLALAGLLLAACRDEDPPPQSPDGGAPDASTSDVARCVELATHFRDHCADANGEDDARVCLWEGYVELCRTGDTALLIAAMECLDDTQCRSFSDANEGGACLDALHAAQPASALRDAIEAHCAACGQTCPASQIEIFPYLPASAATALESCGGADACTADAFFAACTPEIAPLASFQCGQ
ncbi:hypothetical protein [Sandaracinus amylolyticus]|uniref:hypothetical protein n=1 Tax=Sandaracinus amylolyticus TaxID=927083 RepID=UPI001F47FDF3|nr:hypothetical protein [Sandaracinus amylolyticus]